MNLLHETLQMAARIGINKWLFKNKYENLVLNKPQGQRGLQSINSIHTPARTRLLLPPGGAVTD